MLPDGMGWWEAFLLSGQAWRQYQGWGFALGGPWHLVCLVLCGALIIYLVKKYVHMSVGGTSRRRMLLVMGIMPQVSLGLTQYLTMTQGLYGPVSPPLYLCNFSEIFVLADVVYPNMLCDECSFALGFVGGVCALTFPGWIQCPIWSLPSIASFFEHSLLVAFPMVRIASKEFTPDIRHAWMPMVVGASYLLAIMPYNLRFHSNFGFVPDPMGAEPLEYFYQAIGNPGYTIGVFAFGVVVVLSEYIPFVIKR